MLKIFPTILSSLREYILCFVLKSKVALLAGNLLRDPLDLLKYAFIFAKNLDRVETFHKLSNSTCDEVMELRGKVLGTIAKCGAVYALSHTGGQLFIKIG